MKYQQRSPKLSDFEDHEKFFKHGGEPAVSLRVETLAWCSLDARSAIRGNDINAMSFFSNLFLRRLLAAAQS